MSDSVFYLALIFVFGLLPVLFVLGVKGAFGAIYAAPRLLRRFGLGESPWAARAVMAVLIFVPLAIFLPGIAFMVAGLASLLLPVAILLVLLAALAAGLGNRQGGFGEAFWRVARPVPFLCAAFAVTMIPIGIAKYRTTQELERWSQPR